MNTFYAKDRKTWRDWLEKNHDKLTEIWLIKYNKASGKLCVNYNESVEEALCFGWIDGIQKSNDKESSIQRFTPRRAKSNWSEINKERVRKLIKEKQIMPSGLKVLEGVDLKIHPLILSQETETELKKDSTVWNNFLAFDETYKRLRIYYIEDARKISNKIEYKKRLNNFIKATKQNKKIGMKI